MIEVVFEVAVESLEHALFFKKSAAIKIMPTKKLLVSICNCCDPCVVAAVEYNLASGVVKCFLDSRGRDYWKNKTTEEVLAHFVGCCWFTEVSEFRDSLT